MQFRRMRNSGFTLLELLVVLLIIALLAGYVGPKLFGEVGKAKIKTAASQMKSLADALDHYRLDVGHYPTTEQGLTALNTKPNDEPKWQGPYLTKDVPNDPWDRPYVYRRPGENGHDFDLISYGADGKPGGTDEDADISYFQ
ncbi:type II secretion system major pseudopilin GspG [Silvimonas iriomotensis]|uniref:Type II secretion system core protein G n=1 Tax=Silvimonas iriomotensis TaxID=449662 RepID=A0ABQ2P974_9NEIS|nr:type II secretion system major pseudopilin GspG [Silvimonas iriomotensis]GGP21054.1 type II secretion system protein GspG [Silvimonas iriomotensis]